MHFFKAILVLAATIYAVPTPDGTNVEERGMENVKAKRCSYKWMKRDDGDLEIDGY